MARFFEKLAVDDVGKDPFSYNSIVCHREIPLGIDPAALVIRSGGGSLFLSHPPSSVRSLVSQHLIGWPIVDESVNKGVFAQAVDVVGMANELDRRQ